MYVWMLCLFLFPESTEVVKGASILQTRLADQSQFLQSVRGRVDSVEIDLASLFKPCKDEKGSGESIDLQSLMTCCQGCCGIGFMETRREFLPCQQWRHTRYYHVAVCHGFYLFYAVLTRTGHSAGFWRETEYWQQSRGSLTAHFPSLLFTVSSTNITNKLNQPDFYKHNFFFPSACIMTGRLNILQSIKVLWFGYFSKLFCLIESSRNLISLFLSFPLPLSPSSLTSSSSCVCYKGNFATAQFKAVVCAAEVFQHCLCSSG